MTARPTAEQAAWHDLEVGMFIHFAPNTWKDSPTGDLRASEKDDLSIPLDRIVPGQLDTDEWVDVAVQMGARYIVFVAKHVGGFCLWRTETTDYGISHTPWRGGGGDIMARLAESCRRRGVKLGVYLSPQDKKHGAGLGGRCATPSAQAAYNDLYRRQLTELLTRYGEIIEVWFDGSCVVEVGDILKRHAPGAMIFQGPHATIRWVGNEDGLAPYPAWNSLPSLVAKTGMATARHSDPDGDAWLPSEVDVSIRRPYWFWSPLNQSSLLSLDELLKIYYASVGRGAVLLLNHTPDRTGRIPAADAARTREFGDEIRRRFGCPLAAMSVPGEVLEMPLPPGANADHVILMEDIRQGERVREYALEGLVGGQWRELRRGTAIGHKRIEAFSPVAADALSLRCLTVSGPPRIRRFAAFATGSPAPRGLDVPPLVWAADVAGTWRQSRPAERLFRFDLTPFCREAGLYRMRFSAADGVSDPGFRDLVLRVGGVPVSDAIERAHESDSLLLNITGVDTGIVLETRLSALSGAAMVWRTYE